MLKALYYPHTEIQSVTIIKNALLLWDAIETIVPSHTWQPTRNVPDRTFNEAVDLVVRYRVPSKADQRRTHDALMEHLQTGFLQSLIQSTPMRMNRGISVYPGKFLQETWHMLRSGRLIDLMSEQHQYGVHPGMGLLMMSLLADSCAGTQIQKVTDRGQAYSWLAQERARILGSQYVTGLDASQVAPALDRLVTISFEVLDARDVPLKKLLEFRKREAKRGGSDYTAMRRRYFETLKQHIDRIGKEAKTRKDMVELEAAFREAMKQDLQDLKAELELASKKTLLSREIAFSALIVAGSLSAPMAGLTELGTKVGGIGIIPLLKAAVDYRGERRKALRSHVMSWLFLSRQGRLTVY